MRSHVDLFQCYFFSVMVDMNEGEHEYWERRTGTSNTAAPSQLDT